MFEPVSLVGFVGATAGLISFIASTAEKLHDRKVEWQDCKELLGWYRMLYDTTYLELKCWTNMWCGKDHRRPPSAYSYYWGTDGLKAVRERIEGIRREDEKIRGLLFCENIDMSGSPPGTQEKWHQYLKNLVACRSSQPQPEDWMQRFCFALYKHSDIKTRIVRLKERVADLETFSRRTFWTLQEQENAGGEISSSDLSRLHRVGIAMKSLQRFLVALGADRSSQDQWALVLGRPILTESLISLEEDHVLPLEFLVETRVSKSNDWTVSLAYIDCPLTEPKLGNLKNFKKMPSFPPNATELELQAMKDFLKRAMKDDELRKASKLLRAKVASELVDSLILCYGTQCTRALCTCGVQATHLADKEKFWTFRAFSDSHRCHNEDLQDRGFVLLAVALAELAISAPINILQPTPEELKFELSSAKEIKTLGPIGLLSEINRRSCRSYKNAVEYCLEMDRKLMIREIRPEDFPRCIDRIAQP